MTWSQGLFVGYSLADLHAIRRVSGDPVRMESIVSFQAGGAGAAAPRIFFSKSFLNMLFDDAFQYLVTFVIFTISLI